MLDGNKINQCKGGRLMKFNKILIIGFMISFVSTNSLIAYDKGFNSLRPPMLGDKTGRDKKIKKEADKNDLSMFSPVASEKTITRVKLGEKQGYDDTGMHMRPGGFICSFINGINDLLPAEYKISIIVKKIIDGQEIKQIELSSIIALLMLNLKKNDEIKIEINPKSLVSDFILETLRNMFANEKYALGWNVDSSQILWAIFKLKMGYYESRLDAGITDRAMEINYTGTVEKSGFCRYSIIDQIRDTILDPNNKNGIWEEVSPTEVRLKPYTDLKQKTVMEIAKDHDRDGRIWAFLQNSCYAIDNEIRIMIRFDNNKDGDEKGTFFSFRKISIDPFKGPEILEELIMALDIKVKDIQEGRSWNEDRSLIIACPKSEVNKIIQIANAIHSMTIFDLDTGYSDFIIKYSDIRARFMSLFQCDLATDGIRLQHNAGGKFNLLISWHEMRFVQLDEVIGSGGKVSQIMEEFVKKIKGEIPEIEVNLTSSYHVHYDGEENWCYSVRITAVDSMLENILDIFEQYLGMKEDMPKSVDEALKKLKSYI